MRKMIASTHSIGENTIKVNGNFKSKGGMSMTEEEFVKLVKEENLRHDRELKALVRKRIISMARCKVGDVIEDIHGVMIKVKSIGNGGCYGFPQSAKPCYRGVLLTKKGAERKDGEERTILDEHLAKVNGVSILENTEDKK